MFRGASQGPKRLYATVSWNVELWKLPGNLGQTFGATKTIPQAQKDVKHFTCTMQGLCVLVFSRAYGARWFKLWRFLRAFSLQKTPQFKRGEENA
jgi:hypothetical protein